ncbi:MAG TPA: HisS family protein [Methylocella sp.]|jgi:histidyl-tRNA synthetase|nr:HisS family protein [Methylocella sp.]
MNGKKNNMQTARATLPRGFADRPPAEIAATDKMLAVIKESYELYGFEAVETPLIEFTEALGKFLPDQDRPNEGVFSFKDDDESWLSLRYDLTAPLARYVAENFDNLPKPYRSYRAGYVFRNEKPGPGRFRQFMQFDADTVGAASIAADAELCMMAADTLERLGIEPGDYVIKVNNRKVLDGVMEAIGLGGEENAGRRLTVLRAIDKYDRLGLEGVHQLLGPGRKDASGDFTKGAGLDEEAIQVCFIFVKLDDRETGAEKVVSLNSLRLASLRRAVASSKIGLQGIEELKEIISLVKTAGYDQDRIRIDASVVRGLEYYTGPVFEADLTFEVPGEDGKPVRFGSVGGGGRYDGLVGRFRGGALFNEFAFNTTAFNAPARPENVPATGFSIGVSRLYLALKAINSPIVAGTAQRGPIVVLVLDKDHLASYQNFVTKLRAEKISAELYLGQAGMNAQLKYADKRGSICAVIQGSNERNHRDGPQVTIRDLVLGAELAASTKDRADYLELRANAQFTVPEDRLVESVQEVLARHV